MGMRILSLAGAMAGFLLYLLGMRRGKGYEGYIENLDEKEYQLKELYTIGYGLSEYKLFHMPVKLKEKLLRQSSLLYQKVYAEYYTTLAWAQFLSFSVFTVVFVFVLASFFEGQAAVLMWILLILAVAAYWNMFLSKMKENVQKRSEQCDAQFPDMVSKISLLLSSGMVLREAWETVAYGREGALYELMQVTCQDMANGSSDIEAVYRLGVLSDSEEIKKFTGIIVQGLEKGTSDLATVFLNQSNELWAHKRQLMLQKGEKAAGKLIIPVGITFMGIIIMIMAAAMGSFSL